MPYVKNIVVAVREFEEWLDTQADDVHDEIMALVGVLEIYGVTTPYPYSSKVFGSKYKGMRELRTEIDRRAYRVLYIYDPMRRAVLLSGGDKSGDKRWYEKHVPLAEAAYEKYLKEGA